MTLHGQSTLTDAERVTEALTHLKRLAPKVNQMGEWDRNFVLAKAKWAGPGMTISVKELFKLRDLNERY